MTKKIILIRIICLTLFLMASSCANYNMLSLAQEQQMGLSSFQKIKTKNKISYNTTYNSKLRRVGNRIKNVVNYPGAKWEFVVFENSKPNAFALPGGKVGVHTGIFKIARNDAQLAAVIGHEIAHITHRHGGQSVTRQMGVGAVSKALDSVLQNRGAGTMVRKGALVASNVLFVKPYSRNKELEADRIGALYMAKAGYNPRESITLWKRFADYKNKSGGKVPEFLSTHPLDSKRIAQLEAFLPQALAVYHGKKNININDYNNASNSITPRNNYLPRSNYRPSYNNSSSNEMKKSVYRAKKY